ncbi:RNA polymerase sigma factor [Arthrobacter bambusae]|uniref:RNA polymerase sigma factor (Sigma-70 family) n=1 Tax=Arthrobacter bambusae TaxID=1338426 RepID=A0AAW8DA39_9MICC|nr:sigma-70 family RNA polymerase sigma factor [Arthrobacter bambusae]MDP9904673.1 RNA polymerase sigma factor (sigma-70 family) [Arthrobacter bambusae]MDQ0129489.1 RNA polymerase sigma factor (sigma-70 family) [Arthrobacter bambusae]MDQ0180898.1 RNA polymerase sigma factor (sigma-70 family) [Arthrobacter bambusae]
MGAISLHSATKEISDEALILSCRAGDRDAVDVLYRRHHDAAFRFARRLMGNAADADDVAHEAFTKVIAAIKRGNGPDAVFRPYLFKAVRTVAANHWEQQAKETPSEETPDTAVLDLGLEAALNHDSITPVYKAFESLPARWRTVLWHAEVENEPPRRIAPLLGIEPNAVSALLMRARRGLREAYLHQYAAAELPRTDCQPTLPLLAGTVLGTASASDRKAAKEHARTCEDCRKVIAELTDIRKTMRGLVAPLLLFSPTLLPATAPPFPLWKPKPPIHTGFLAAGSIIAAAAAVTFALVIFIQTTGAPTPSSQAVQESPSTAPRIQVPAPANRTPGSVPVPPTLESSPAGLPTAAAPEETDPLTTPAFPRQPANPVRNPAPGPPGNYPTFPASTSVTPVPSPTATTAATQFPSPSKPSPAPTATPTLAPAPGPSPSPSPSPSPGTAIPTPTPSATASTGAPAATSSASPGPPSSPGPACVPFFFWCLPV